MSTLSIILTISALSLSLLLTLAFLSLVLIQSHRRVGGIHFLRAGRIRIQISVVKRTEAEIVLAKQQTTLAKLHATEIRRYWERKGMKAHQRQVDLRNRTNEAALDRFMKELTAEPWEADSFLPHLNQ